MTDCPSSCEDFRKIEGGLEISVSAPGKVILHGEHAVVYGKKAVAAALGLRSRLKIVEIDRPDVIVLHLAPFQYMHQFKISDVQKLWSIPSKVIPDTSNFNISTPTLLDFDSVSKQVDELLQNLLENDILSNSGTYMALKCFLFLLAGMVCSLNLELTSVTVKIDSELQIGAGTGSSASFSVCGAAGLLQYFKLKTNNVSNISKDGFKPLDWKETDFYNLQKFSEKQLDMICQWSFLGEKIFHGMPSGIDNTVCTYGNMVEFRKGDKPLHIQLKTTFDLLLINTNVSRNTAQLVAKVSAFRAEFPELTDKILDCIEKLTLDAISTIKKLEICTSDEQFLKDFKNLTWLSQMNHIFLMSLDVSHPKLQHIMTVLEDNHLNGKLTGAGGGGYAIALLPPNFDVTRVKSDLEKGGYGVFCTKLGGVGVTVE